LHVERGRQAGYTSAKRAAAIAAGNSPPEAVFAGEPRQFSQIYQQFAFSIRRGIVLAHGPPSLNSVEELIKVSSISSVATSLMSALQQRYNANASVSVMEIAETQPVGATMGMVTVTTGQSTAANRSH
jgi:hypothetical protein